MQRKIILTRDSVSAGDDMNGNHFTEIWIGEDDKIGAILKAIEKIQYLPEISGDKATWSVADTNPLAVIAQEWTEPKLIVFPEYPFQGTPVFRKIERLHFNYFAQKDPSLVFSILREYNIPNI